MDVPQLPGQVEQSPQAGPGNVQPASGLIVFNVFVIFAGVVASFIYVNARKQSGDSGHISTPSQEVDPLEVARRVESRLHSLFMEASRQFDVNNGSTRSDYERLQMLEREWREALRRMNDLEVQEARRHGYR